MVVVAVSSYEIFYGPSRELNVVSAVILALGLFAVRKHYRVSYGAIEIAFSMFVLFHDWTKGRGAFSSGFSSDFDIWAWQIIFVQTFTAIYIFIRGMDNIDAGSKEGKASHPAVVWGHAWCRSIIAWL
jgi:hypothetical protein